MIKAIASISTILSIIFANLCYANEFNKILNQTEVKAFDSLYTKYFVNNKLYIVYIDFNDCLNCNLAFNFILKYNTIDLSNTILQIKQLPVNKIEAFRKRYKLDSNIVIISNDSNRNSLLEKQLNSKNNYRSCVFQYNKNSPLILYKELIGFNSQAAVTRFFSGLNHFREKTFEDDNSFYSEFKQVSRYNNKYLCITSPSSNIIVFDTALKFIKEINFVDTFLVKIASKIILNRYDKLVQSDTNNTTDNIIRNYINDIKPLGYEMFQLNRVFTDDTYYYALGSIAIPVTTSFEKISFGGQAFVFRFNSELSLIDIKPYQTFDLKGFVPIDIFGAHFDKHDKSINISISKFNTNYINSCFTGKWLERSNGYDFLTIDSSLCLKYTSSISEFVKKYKEQTYQYETINDSCLYFRNIPNLLIGNKSISTISDSCNYFNYKNYVTIFNEKNEFISIEKFSNSFYLTKYLPDFKRQSMSLLNIPKSIKSHFFHIKGDRIFLVGITEKGTVQYEFSY